WVRSSAVSRVDRWAHSRHTSAWVARTNAAADAASPRRAESAASVIGSISSIGNSSGTSALVPPTNTCMKCDRIREAASARLDGEPLGMSATALDHPLTSCLDCARWLEAATRVTRQARIGAAEVPDLAERILAGAVLPARRVLRRRRLLRLALAVVGAVPVGIAAPSPFGGSIGLAMSVHAAHENAAPDGGPGAAVL